MIMVKSMVKAETVVKVVVVAMAAMVLKVIVVVAGFVVAVGSNFRKVVVQY